MLVWLTLPFYDFCGFRSVAVNSVYKLQFFTFIAHNAQGSLDKVFLLYGDDITSSCDLRNVITDMFFQ